MFTCKAIKNGVGYADYLRKHYRANDYYDKGNEITGHWIGAGAKELGLEGKVVEHKDPAFEALRLRPPYLHRDEPCSIQYRLAPDLIG